MEARIIHDHRGITVRRHSAREVSSMVMSTLRRRDDFILGFGTGQWGLSLCRDLQDVMFWRISRLDYDT